MHPPLEIGGEWLAVDVGISQVEPVGRFGHLFSAQKNYEIIHSDMGMDQYLLIPFLMR